MQELNQKIKSGFFWDMLGSFFKQGSGIIVTIFLARLLSPEEFGIIAMAMVFIAISNAFVDVGFTQGLIQTQEVDNEHYNSVFIFNIFLSTIVGLVLFYSATAIGSFYESNEVSKVVKYLAFIPLIASLGLVHQAILIRNMAFKPLAFRITLSSIIGGVVGITTAYFGQGVFSLVWKELASTTLATIVLWYGSKWLPNLKFRLDKLKDLFIFSQYVFLDDLVRKVFTRLNPLFIGKIYSPVILGLFGKAESLNLVVNDYTTKSLRRVMFPALSSLQNSPVEFKETFLKVMSISSVASSFIAGVMYFMAPSFIVIVLGDQWTDAIPLFKTLVFVTLISPHISLNAQSILSKGFSKTKLYMQFFHRTLTLLPLLVGLFYGIEVFTLTFVLSKFLVLFIYIVFVHNKIDISWNQQWSILIRTLIPLILSVIFIESVFPTANDFIKTLFFISFNTIALYHLKNDTMSWFFKHLKGLISQIKVN